LRSETKDFFALLVTNDQGDSERETIDHVGKVAKKGISMAQVETTWNF